jgi:hypothetical protein
MKRSGNQEPHTFRRGRFPRVPIQLSREYEAASDRVVPTGFQVKTSVWYWRFNIVHNSVIYT